MYSSWENTELMWGSFCVCELTKFSVISCFLPRSVLLSWVTDIICIHLTFWILQWLECSSIGMILTGVNRRTRENPVPMSLCPQIPHGLTQARNRDSAVRGPRLTTWAMVRTEGSCYVGVWEQVTGHQPNVNTTLQILCIVCLSSMSWECLR
jgi:hypothetical protein